AWRKVTSESCEAAVRRTVHRLRWKRPIALERRIPDYRYTHATPPSMGAYNTPCNDQNALCPSDSRHRTNCTYNRELWARQRH
ncbi:unnamed protein product, partial [Heterotrigona itama]